MKIVLRPTLSEFLFLIIWAGVAALIFYAAYLGSWSFGYAGDHNSGYQVFRKWSPDMLTLGLLTFGMILLAGATELLARSVTLDSEFLSSRSPLGLYRQALRRADIADVRVSRILGWGRVVEVLLKGRWIVFVANARFTDTPDLYLAPEKTSNQLPDPTSESGRGSS